MTESIPRFKKDQVVRLKPVSERRFFYASDSDPASPFLGTLHVGDVVPGKHTGEDWHYHLGAEGSHVTLIAPESCVDAA